MPYHALVIKKKYIIIHLLVSTKEFMNQEVAFQPVIAAKPVYLILLMMIMIGIEHINRSKALSSPFFPKLSIVCEN